MKTRLFNALTLTSAMLCLAVLAERCIHHWQSHLIDFVPSHIVGNERVVNEVFVCSGEGLIIAGWHVIRERATEPRSGSIFTICINGPCMWNPAGDGGIGGFAVYSIRRSFPGPAMRSRVEHGINVPCWFVALLFAILPARWLHAWWRRRCKAGWKMRGLCALCGYDLRASPAKCPECGAIADANPAA